MFFDEKIIEWDSDMLSFAKYMYDGKFYAVEKEEKKFAFAFLYQNENVTIIKEILAEENEDIANFIATELECNKMGITYFDPGGCEGFMVYPNDAVKAYFNIYFD